MIYVAPESASESRVHTAQEPVQTSATDITVNNTKSNCR